VRRTGRICLTLLVLALFAAGGAGAEASTPFVTVNVPLNQTLNKLLRGKFAETVTCRASCTVIARIFIGPTVARKLGFHGVKAGQPYAVGLRQLRLPGKRPTHVGMALGRDAKSRLWKWKQTLQITGETYASAASSRDRGQANWVTTLRR
jgi:hypothetical protein